MRFDMHNLKVIPCPLYDIHFTLYLIVSMLGDQSPPTGLFFSVCLYVYRMSQKVVDGFGWNFVDRVGVWQGWTDWILVKIRIRLLEFLHYSILHHWEMGLNQYIARYLKKLSTDSDKTWRIVWVYDKNKLIRFWLCSGYRSGLSMGYKT